MIFNMRYYAIYLLLSLSLFANAQNIERRLAFDNYHKYDNREIQSCDSSEIRALDRLRTYYHENPYRIKVNKDTKLINSYLNIL